MKVILLTSALAMIVISTLFGQGAPDPNRFKALRSELDSSLKVYQATAQSQAFSPSMRNRAQQMATQIQERLEQGDFRIGDRIVLEVQGEDSLPDTVLVQAGPSLMLNPLGQIPLAGVLRSEVQQHLTRQLAVYIRNPIVLARPLIRVQLEGEVGQIGFHDLEADRLLSQALTAAGGPNENADLDNLQVMRGDAVLLEGDELSRALVEGRSLDQLNIRSGDRITVPERTTNIFLTAGRYVLIAVSTLLLGIRIF